MVRCRAAKATAATRAARRQRVWHRRHRRAPAREGTPRCPAKAARTTSTWMTPAPTAFREDPRPSRSAPRPCRLSTGRMAAWASTSSSRRTATATAQRTRARQARRIATRAARGSSTASTAIATRRRRHCNTSDRRSKATRTRWRTARRSAARLCQRLRSCRRCTALGRRQRSGSWIAAPADRACTTLAMLAGVHASIVHTHQR
mmetsp:Transcript_38770/g.124437  ORF Transcript_38770/g.124437 Transcript_38770/m.124437 type:complete len:204 (-) Transcript_38770:628-1239(-)